MIELFNASVYQQMAGFHGVGWDAIADFAREHNMQGIELLIDIDGPPDDLPPGLVYGVHLPIWITWLDIWRNQPDAVQRYYQGEQDWARRYAGGIWRSQMLNGLTCQLNDAARLGATYAVVHAAHVEFAHAFTRAYTYTDLEVLDAFASALSTVAEMGGGEPPVTLYIENVWWPGLTFADPTMAEYLARCLTFDNWAFVLDTAHLMNTRHGLRTEQDAIFFVLDRIEALSAAVRDRIACVHLNLSLSGEYQRSTIAAGLPEAYADLPFAEQFILARNHVGRIDQHRPFTVRDCQRIIEAVEPLIVVHELAANSAAALSQALKTQYRALHHLPKTEGGTQ